MIDKGLNYAYPQRFQSGGPVDAANFPALMRSQSFGDVQRELNRLNRERNALSSVGNKRLRQQYNDQIDQLTTHAQQLHGKRVQNAIVRQIAGEDVAIPIDRLPFTPPNIRSAAERRAPPASAAPTGNASTGNALTAAEAIALAGQMTPEQLQEAGLTFQTPEQIGQTPAAEDAPPVFQPPPPPALLSPEQTLVAPPMFQPPMFQPPVFQPPMFQPPMFQPPMFQPPSMPPPPQFQQSAASPFTFEQYLAPLEGPSQAPTIQSVYGNLQPVDFMQQGIMGLPSAGLG